MRQNSWPQENMEEIKMQQVQRESLLKREKHDRLIGIAQAYGRVTGAMA